MKNTKFAGWVHLDMTMTFTAIYLNVIGSVRDGNGVEFLNRILKWHQKVVTWRI